MLRPGEDGGTVILQAMLELPLHDALGTLTGGIEQGVRQSIAAYLL